jgi:3-oxoacyl-[acyl-carrier protein] reductase
MAPPPLRDNIGELLEQAGTIGERDARTLRLRPYGAEDALGCHS